jgi:hypothetical protein
MATTAQVQIAAAFIKVITPMLKEDDNTIVSVDFNNGGIQYKFAKPAPDSVQMLMNNLFSHLKGA